MMLPNKKKRAQVTIWIILGIVLVASFILFFAIERVPKLIKPEEAEQTFDLQSYLDECIKQDVEKMSDIILPQGGFIRPRNFVLYDGIKIEYHCEHIGNYDNCVNQHSALVSEIEEEIKNYLQPRIEQCIEKMQARSTGDFQIYPTENFEARLIPDKLILTLDKRITIEKQGERKVFDKLRFEIQSPIFSLAKIAMEIASQESLYGYFEYFGFSVLYPKYKIDYHAVYNSIEIYSITDKKTGKKMNIAIRGSVNPHGLGLAR